MLISYIRYKNWKFIFKMRFAHIADSHLGGWRHKELQFLNMESFKKAIKTCIDEKVEFILFSGDLFDSPFP
ncbi:hypothetical protein GF386_03380, partial [Candidatus Pacearchaeota archaeon]|nr:hypothetical protein [Candidatus Pacearchaeota archaeon]MBD3283183.1 hypothetical protein [Candidatus Pacearchaeota archaeon]